MQSRNEGDDDAKSEAKSEGAKSEDLVNPKDEYIMDDEELGVILELPMISCLVCLAVLMTNLQCDKTAITVNRMHRFLVMIRWLSSTTNRSVDRNT